MRIDEITYKDKITAITIAIKKYFPDAFYKMHSKDSYGRRIGCPDQSNAHTGHSGLT